MAENVLPFLFVFEDIDWLNAECFSNSKSLADSTTPSP